MKESEARALVQQIALSCGGDSLDDEMLLDAAMNAFFTDADRALLKHLYLHGPQPVHLVRTDEACSTLQNEFELVVQVVLVGGFTGLALNALGQPYGRLLAARK